MRTWVLPLVALVVVPALLSAQPGPGAPTGAPGVYFAHDPLRIGGDINLDFGHTGTPFALTILSVSDGFGPTNHPSLGPVWLDITSPAYAIFLYVSDAFGNVHLSAPVPAAGNLFNLPPIYVNGFVADPSLPAPGWGLSKTVRISYETQDGYRPTGSMLTPRFLHTATSLAGSAADDHFKVLIAGGSDSGSIFNLNPQITTELYNPLTRSFESGPNMTVPRSGHAAVRLQNGKVLITGGVRLADGWVTTSCDLYDPVLNTISPTGSLAYPRTGHAMTLLPDGRVLVTGGLYSWQNAASQFAAALATSLPNGEIYDPATGQWTLIPQLMADKRSGHRQILLPNGLVLVISGVNGGTLCSGTIGCTTQVPTYTDTCEIYNPLTNGFTLSATLTGGRGWFGASLLNNGDVLVTGGATASANYGAAAATTSCVRWNGALWQNTGSLQQPIAFHRQVRSAWNGDAVTNGGFTGDLTTLAATAEAGRHSGLLYGTTQSLGTHLLIPGSSPTPRGNHTLTRLYDGSYLVAGGSDQTQVLATANTVVEE